MISWISSKAVSNTIYKQQASGNGCFSFGIFRFSALSETGDTMKTVRILLYPSDQQLVIMEEITKIYCDFLWRGVIQKSRDMLPEEVPDALCFSSAAQLYRDIQRRLCSTHTVKSSLPHLYCRWGNDYRLSDCEVILPLGKGFETDELRIACVYRTFQTILLIDKHPETLVLKRMKNHWFAYVLVEGDI